MMSLGRASGWIEWGEEKFEFENTPAYSEKNWGGGFPKKWFWIQCEAFDSPEGQEIALTSVGMLLLSFPFQIQLFMFKTSPPLQQVSCAADLFGMQNLCRV